MSKKELSFSNAHEDQPMHYIKTIIAVIILIVIPLVFIVNTHNGMVRTENSIDAAYKAYENVYSNYFLSIKEMAKVSDKYSERFKEVYDDIMTKRYEGGQDAMFKLIREDNPNFDASLFTALQQKIASGRKEMTLQEQIIVDSKRIAYNKLDQLVSGTILKTFDFPKKNYGYNGGADDYVIAQATETIEMKETGVKQMVEF